VAHSLQEVGSVSNIVKQLFTLFFLTKSYLYQSLYSAKTWHARLLYSCLCLHSEYHSPVYCPGFDISSIETHLVLDALH